MPVNPLPRSESDSRRDISPNQVGIRPGRWFPPRSSRSSLSRFRRAAGIVPVSALFASERDRRLESSPNQAGTGPVRLFPPRPSHSSRGRSRKTFGTGPVSSFSPSQSNQRLDSSPIQPGTSPVRLFPLRFRDASLSRSRSAAGIVPVNSFPQSERSRRPDSSRSDPGMTPVRSFPPSRSDSSSSRFPSEVGSEPSRAFSSSSSRSPVHASSSLRRTTGEARRPCSSLSGAPSSHRPWRHGGPRARPDPLRHYPGQPPRPPNQPTPRRPPRREVPRCAAGSWCTLQGGPVTRRGRGFRSGAARKSGSCGLAPIRLSGSGTGITEAVTSCPTQAGSTGGGARVRDHPARTRLRAVAPGRPGAGWCSWTSASSVRRWTNSRCISSTTDGAPGWERRSSDRHARGSAPRTSLLRADRWHLPRRGAQRRR